MSACDERSRFRDFLKTINLDYYREKFKEKKYVEQDLPKGVTSILLKSMYEVYWEKKTFLQFENWFNILWDRVKEFKEFTDFIWKYFHMKLGKDKEWDEWFKEGFKARMYRTWTAMLTQFDFCYSIACIIEKEVSEIRISSNPTLNKEGVDLRIMVGNSYVDFQVYKISERKEARAGTSKKEIMGVPYPVLSRRELVKRITSPYTKKREAYKIILETFDRFYAELENGFIVFGDELVKEIIRRLTDKENLKKFLQSLDKCLRGEKCTLLSN